MVRNPCVRTCGGLEWAADFDPVRLTDKPFAVALDRPKSELDLNGNGQGVLVAATIFAPQLRWPSNSSNPARSLAARECGPRHHCGGVFCAALSEARHHREMIDA